MAEKNSFILHLKYGSIFAEMSDKQAGVLIKAIFNYIATGETMEGLNDVEVKTAFKFIKLDLDFANAKYEYTCAQNSLNGKRGGAPKGNSNAKKQPKQANGCFETGRLKNNPIDIDVDIDIEKEKLKKEKGASLPSFEDFWKAYPKKTTKKECQDWWKKNPAKRQAAIDGLEYYKRSTDAQFYLDPIRYLKRERWQDMPDNYQSPAATTPPKPEERPLSAQEAAEKARWDSLSEAERKAELDAILRG